MSQTIIANTYFEREQTFAHLTLRRDGADFFIEEVAGVIEDGRRGELFVRWAGKDAGAGAAEFDRQAEVRRSAGFVACRP